MRYKQVFKSHHRASSGRTVCLKPQGLRLAVGLLGMVLAETSLSQEQEINFNIQPQPASSALIALGRQADITVLVKDDARNVRVSGLKGTYRVEDAIKLLLKDTGLVYHFKKDSIIVSRGLEDGGPKSRNNHSRNGKESLLAGLAALFTSTLMVSPAVAQEEGVKGIEEIIVTAQKRSENLQDVPIAITAVTGEDLSSAGVSDMLLLQQVVPSLNIGTGGSTALVFMRGVGTQNPSIGDESSVATYIDGVYQASPAANIFNLTNIERVEVLKGPQGTLFGRNATGGLINIITRNPSFTSGFEGNVSYGNRDRVETSLYATGGLSESVAMDVALQYTNQDEGYGTNLQTGNGANQSQEHSLRSKLLYDSGGDFTALLSGYYSRTDSSLGVSRKLAPGAVGIDGSTFAGGFYDADTNLDSLNDVERFGGALRLDIDLGGVDLVSITAYQRDDADLVFTQTATPARQIDVDIVNGNRFFTQEIQLLSDSEGPLSWIAGIFFMDGKGFYGPLRLSGPAIGGVLDIYGEVKTTSYSGFIQTGYQLSDRTTLTAGVRYTSDERKLSGRNEFDGFVIFTDDRKARWSKPSWRISLDHQLTDDVLIYGSYNRGFKSGLFSTAALGAPEVNPETLDAYEIGFKATSPNRMLRLNGAVFYYQYEDIQLTKVAGGALQVLNAAEATLHGLDVDAEIFLSPRLSLTLGGSYVDGEYDKFPDGPVWTPNPEGGNIPGVEDLFGNRLVRSPELTGNIGIKASFPTSSGRLDAHANLYHSGSFFFEAENRLKQDSYTVLNGQITYHFADDRWKVWLYGRNLTDTEYLIFGESGALGDIVSAAPGRAYGIGIGFQM